MPTRVVYIDTVKDTGLRCDGTAACIFMRIGSRLSLQHLMIMTAGSNVGNASSGAPASPGLCKGYDQDLLTSLSFCVKKGHASIVWALAMSTV